MKSSELAEARKLVDNRTFYLTMLFKLQGYPGYDAVLEVDGKRLMISRTQAIVILEDYLEGNEKEMVALGLEYEQEFHGKPSS